MPWVATLDDVNAFVQPFLLGLGLLLAARFLWRVFTDA